MHITADELDAAVAEILRRRTAPMTMPQIEAQLPADWKCDTFDVRDAVWRLIGSDKVTFTPARYVTLT